MSELVDMTLDVSVTRLLWMDWKHFFLFFYFIKILRFVYFSLFYLSKYYVSYILLSCFFFFIYTYLLIIFFIQLYICTIYFEPLFDQLLNFPHFSSQFLRALAQNPSFSLLRSPPTLPCFLQPSNVEAHYEPLISMITLRNKPQRAKFRITSKTTSRIKSKTTSRTPRGSSRGSHLERRQTCQKNIFSQNFFTILSFFEKSKKPIFSVFGQPFKNFCFRTKIFLLQHKKSIIGKLFQVK